MSSELQWGDWEYRRFGFDFGLEGLKPLDGEQFKVRKQRRVKEEVLETFVMLHLRWVTGLPLHFVSRSHTGLGGGEDLVAWDELGRVHLFELKNGRGSNKSINDGVVAQLAQYMMKHMFRPPVDFIEEQWQRGNQVWFQQEVLAGYLAGAFLNERVCKFGFDQVTEYLTEDHGHGEWISYGDWPPSRNWWDRKSSRKKASGEEKDRLRFEAAVAAAREELDEQGITSGPSSFPELAEQWREKVGRPRRPVLRKFKARRPVVMWFVAPNVASSGQQAIVDWRAKGVDARAVRVDLQQYTDGDGFNVRVNRENVPQRGRIEKQLFEHARNEIGGAAVDPPKLQLEFYDEKRSSGSQKPRHGSPLDNPRAKFENIEEPNWQVVE